MLTIKKLKSASASLKRLEDLDKEIIQIEAYAEKIKDKNLSIKLGMSYDTPKEEAVSIDEDGSIELGSAHTGLFKFAFATPFGYMDRKQEGNKDHFSLTISEVTALQMLGVIHAFKEAERMEIIRHLEEMWVGQ